MSFRSRPRRFGKTLTISTLKAIFQGRRDLFKWPCHRQVRLRLEDYPVIRIDFGKCDEQTPEDLEACRRMRKTLGKENVGISFWTT